MGDLKKGLFSLPGRERLQSNNLLLSYKPWKKIENTILPPLEIKAIRWIKRSGLSLSGRRKSQVSLRVIVHEGERSVIIEIVTKPGLFYQVCMKPKC